MRTIHKFLMPKEGGEYLGHNLPAGFVVRKIDTQGHATVAWIEVDTDRKPVYVFFFSYGTGWEVPKYLKYAGTVQCGMYVWSIFYKEEEGNG